MLGCLLALSACEAQGPAPPDDLQSAAVQQRGRALFLEHCAICHGRNADGRGRRRASLFPPPADFTDPSWARDRTPSQTFLVIRNGIRGTPMAAWKVLDERQTWDLVAYLRSVGRRRTQEQP